MRKITIIGAGIGGLTTAIALQKKGIDFEIFESFEAFKPLGAGIILANNAMKVYQKLGLHEQLINAGNLITNFNITDPDLKIISTIPQPKADGIQAISIHRGKLQEILLKQIPSEKIHLNKKLKSIKVESPDTVLHFEDGSSHAIECLIGADGIHSTVRNCILKNSQIREAGQLCCRGVLNYDLPPDYKDDLNEIWGKGKRFGMVQIADNKVYWYAVMNSKTTQPITISELTDIYQSFDPLINTLIKNTPEDQLLFNKMTDLKIIPHWFKDNVCLIGDAAHATTPNMGQGACQAIEDAFVLANSLYLEENISNAFARYQKLRKQKADKVVNMSWKMGKLSQKENLVILTLRNKFMRVIPKYLAEKRNAYLYKIAE